MAQGHYTSMDNKLLKTLISNILNESVGKANSPEENTPDSLQKAGKEKRKLRVFDFDDTLVQTQSRVKLTKANGTVRLLTPGEYAVYEKEPTDTFDFSHFQDLIKPEEIRWMTKILKRVINKNGVNAAVILTARGSKKPVEKFFDLLGIPRIPIVALSDSDPHAKAQWILYVIKKFNYDVVEFFDDSEKNIKEVQALEPLVPGTKIITRLIKHKKPKTA